MDKRQNDRRRTSVKKEHDRAARRALAIAKEKRSKADVAKRWKNIKLRLIGVIVMAVIVYLSYAILDLKNQFGDKYEAKAVEQNLSGKANSDRIINPNRGSIVDRNMQGLAVSSTVYKVFVDVRMLDKQEDKYKEGTKQAIKAVFGTDDEIVDQLLAKDPQTEKLVNDTNYYIIEKKVSFTKKQEFEKWKTEHDTVKVSNVYFDDDTERTYVHGNLASSLIGFNRDVWWGVEKQYNKYLSGTSGRSFRAYDNEGNVVTDGVAAVPGYTAVMTIDTGIQQIGEAYSKKWCDDYEASYGAVIVMVPKTGEILAMAQYPTVDANDPANLSKITDQTLAAELSQLDEGEQIKRLYSLWGNFNVNSTFEPGSIFKPITVAMALEEGVISLDETFYCSGHEIVADRDISCSKVHGMQTLDEAIANSCNVAMMKIGAKIGRENFWKYQKDFGYGVKTGIDLPGEEKGLVFPETGLNVTELATSSFGQRFRCTPLQSIASFCTVINGGNYMKPYVVSQIIDQNGSIIMENEPVTERKVISQETSDYLRVTMQKVIDSGTGRNAAIPGYAMGGKTATGEQGVKGTPDYSYSFAFIGYFPVDNPQYCVLTMVHEVPKAVYDGGKKSVAKMYQEVVQEIIKYKAIPPTEQVEGAAGGDGYIIVEDYVGKTVKDATISLNAAGLDYNFAGASGTIVISQFPAAGARATKSSSVLLTISNDGGYDLQEMPNVTGHTPEQAGALLEAAGFVPRVYYDNPIQGEEGIGVAEESNTVKPTPAAETSVIYEQVPKQGVKLMVGSEIKLKAN